MGGPKGGHMRERPIQTNLNTQFVTAVLHSSIEGIHGDEDPRVRAANTSNVLLESIGGLPTGVVWCDEAVEEVRRLRGE